METQAMRIRRQLDKHGTVQGLMCLVNKEIITKEHAKQDPNKAKGIDGVTKIQYDENLDENIENLLARMKSFEYKPLPVRRTYIPKLNGKLRPLGIPSYEDRLVQGVMAGILNDIYENIFLDCSFGFRPHRGCHDAIRAIDNIVMHENVNWILEADIKGFFDHVDHEWLMKFLEHVIKDSTLLRYIKRFLIAGIMEDGVLKESVEGTPQGGLISPVLANVYLHYVLDTWITYAIIPHLKGKARYVRYADDFIILFEREDEAKETMELLKERLAKFSLEVAVDKTRILPFGPRTGTKEEFDFLGFTFFNAKSRRGRYMVGIRTCKKKFKAKMQAVKQWITKRMHEHVGETLHDLNLKLKGHCQYYGINGNFKMIAKFHRYAQYITLKILRRRGQRGQIPWERFASLWKMYIEGPRIMVNIWYAKPKNV